MIIKKPAIVLVLICIGSLLVQCSGDEYPAQFPAASNVSPVVQTIKSDESPGQIEKIANQPAALEFTESGYTNYGTWQGSGSVMPSRWQPGQVVTIASTFKISDSHLSELAVANKIKIDGICLLVTAERTFDADGVLRLSSDERMSTLVTPTGLAIEGGVQGAVTNRFGYDFRTPVDEFIILPLSALTKKDDQYTATFNIRSTLPGDLPPGIYRIRLDYGVTANKRYYNLNCDAFAKRPFFKGRPTESHLYSPPIPASGRHVSGKWVDASTIKPRIPWIILSNYNSNGYRGVVADEDLTNFALSERNIIPDDVILPLYNDSKQKLSYSLEPTFPADTIEARSAIPWDYSTGEISIQVTAPDGTSTDLGTARFVAKAGAGATTRSPAFTAWKPAAYGQYTVHTTGWMMDIWGNRYEGGGTYHFWIAKRMTLATATFQGFSYPVGSRYGRDIGFAPAVPADVTVTATLYVNSDASNTRTVISSGKATPGGIFGVAQGAKQLPLDAPGEYHAHVLATYKDADGHLWVSSMRHAGVVYPEDSPIMAHGKKITINNKMFDRGETNFEGHIHVETDTPHLAHVNYPYYSGDVLLIASEQQGANKIEPVLTFDYKDKPLTYDAKWQNIGISNIKLKTSNGYSPHMFPEYITDWMYFYASAPRPGFMSRFIVGEDGTRAPYWPTSPNNFGGQFNASSNGDVPGDIYRLLGGVVVKKKGETPLYAGYLSSAFLLPKGSENNRVIAPGSEDVNGPENKKARFFLVGTRPGMVYETGATFTPALQIDPILPVNIRFALIYPDGRRVTAEGTGDKFGSFAGKDRWPLDIAGVYRFTIEADWQGFKGFMPGLSREGGEFYVIEKDKAAGAPLLKLNLPEQSAFPTTGVLKITGVSTGQVVHFAAVIPGAVIDQGSVTVTGGKFEYTFDPAAINKKTPTYDIINLVSGKPEIKDIVHLTFFSREAAKDGSVGHSFVRLILRGTTVLYTK